MKPKRMHASRRNLGGIKEDIGRKICELGVGTSIITLGEKGILCTRSIDDYDGLYIPAFQLNDKVIDTVGAGDVFNGAFATAISNGIGIEDALFFANK